MSAPAAASKKKVRLDVDRTRGHLEQLGLAYASERLGDLLSEAKSGCGIIGGCTFVNGT